MRIKLQSLSSFLLFISIGGALWITQGSIFFLFNFMYIGGFVSLGIYLIGNKRPYGRNVAEIGVGLYMFLLLGIFAGENMQIEGFFYYLFLGVLSSFIPSLSIFFKYLGGSFLKSSMQLEQQK